MWKTLPNKEVRRFSFAPADSWNPAPCLSNLIMCVVASSRSGGRSRALTTQKEHHRRPSWFSSVAMVESFPLARGAEPSCANFLSSPTRCCSASVIRSLLRKSAMCLVGTYYFPLNFCVLSRRSSTSGPATAQIRRCCGKFRDCLRWSNTAHYQRLNEMATRRPWSTGGFNP